MCVHIYTTDPYDITRTMQWHHLSHTFMYCAVLPRLQSQRTEAGMGNHTTLCPERADIHGIMTHESLKLIVAKAVGVGVEHTSASS